MNTYTRLLWLDIKSRPRFNFFFILNLAFGLTGFGTLEIFKESFSKQLNQTSKEILTADLSIAGRRLPNPEERSQINSLLQNKVTTQSKQISLYSMINNDSMTRLVQLRAVDDAFPIYGQFELDEQISLRKVGDSPALGAKQVVWVFPELLEQMNLKIGDSITIGKAQFTIAHTVSKSPGVSFSGVSFAPTIFIHKNNLPQTQLIQFGTTAWYTSFYKVVDEKQVDSLVSQLEDKLKDPALYVASDNQRSNQTGRLLNYLSDYLGLISLVGLFLACLGAAYLFRTFLNSKLNEYAILSSLGASQKLRISSTVLHILALSLFAGLLSSLVSYGIALFAPYMLAEVLPVSLSIGLGPTAFLKILFISLCSGVLIFLPFSQTIQNLSSAHLFNEFSEQRLNWNGRQISSWMLIIGALLGISIIQSNSVQVGSLFTFGFLGAGLFIGGLVLIFLKVMEAFAEKTKSVGVKLSLLSLTRHRFQTLMIFLSLGLGVMLLQLIPQISSWFESELIAPKDGSQPSLFFFDIQEEQVEPLEQLLAEDNLKLNSLSPMVRARLSKINDRPYIKDRQDEAFTREQERARRQRNRGYNLTYRDSITAFEKIIAGQAFDAVKANPEEELISLETRFAERIGVGIGDRLTFDVSGIEVEGKVVNLRSVKWTSFQPNFFVVFKPGLLSEAPKTFLASLPPTDLKAQIQARVAQNLPNISMIDVSRLTKEMKELSDNLLHMLKVMAWFAFIAGGLTLFSITQFRILSQQRDIGLLKTLGANHSLIQQSHLFEQFLINLFACLGGGAMALVLSGSIIVFVFDGTMNVDTTSWLEIGSLVLLFALSVSFASTKRVLNTPAKSSLNPIQSF